MNSRKKGAEGKKESTGGDLISKLPGRGKKGGGLKEAKAGRFFQTVGEKNPRGRGRELRAKKKRGVMGRETGERKSRRLIRVGKNYLPIMRWNSTL